MNLRKKGKNENNSDSDFNKKKLSFRWVAIAYTWFQRTAPNHSEPFIKHSLVYSNLTG